MKTEFYWQTLVFFAIYIVLMLIYKKISEKGIAKDKLLHGSLSFLIVVLLALFFKSIVDSMFLITIFAVGLTIMIGITKELYDYFSGRGHCDIKDVVADLIGIGFGTAMIIAMFIAAS